MSRSFKAGDRVIVKFPKSKQNHLVVRWGSTMDGAPMLITKKEMDETTTPIIRRVGSIILENTVTEYQWFYEEYMGNSIWNTMDKVTLNCWGINNLGG